MHDNTLARALFARGVDVQLIPLYTPIRTDEDSVTVDRVFFGGVNVYLQEKIPLFRYLPRIFDRWFDSPSFLNWATAGAAETDPKLLGGLMVSMLRGESGRQRKELAKLGEYLRGEVQPDVIVLTNMLIAGCVPAIKKQTGARVFVTLQGDDIFLDEITEPYKTQAFAEIDKLKNHVDGFLTHSEFYADAMSEYFGIERSRFRITPLGLDTNGFETGPALAAAEANRPRQIGYLARLAPEKGLHLLVDAFIHLRKQLADEEGAFVNTKLQIAGWLGDQHKTYAETQFAKLNDAGLADSWNYAGSIDRNEKLAFLRDLHLLSVPTVYREPKGLFALEAMAAGVPIVQPDHGAFPELIAQTGGGILVRPEDPVHLAEGLARLLREDSHRDQLSQAGREAVLTKRNAQVMADDFMQAIEQAD